MRNSERFPTDWAAGWQVGYQALIGKRRCGPTSCLTVMLQCADGARAVTKGPHTSHIKFNSGYTLWSEGIACGARYLFIKHAPLSRLPGRYKYGAQYTTYPPDALRHSERVSVGEARIKMPPGNPGEDDNEAVSGSAQRDGQRGRGEDRGAPTPGNSGGDDCVEASGTAGGKGGLRCPPGNPGGMTTRQRAGQHGGGAGFSKSAKKLRIDYMQCSKETIAQFSFYTSDISGKAWNLPQEEQIWSASLAINEPSKRTSKGPRGRLVIFLLCAVNVYCDPPSPLASLGLASDFYTHDHLHTHASHQCISARVIAYWSDYSPLIKANLVRFPAGPLPDFRRWESCRTCFLGYLPPSPPLHSGAALYSPTTILIGSQELDIKGNQVPPGTDPPKSLHFTKSASNQVPIRKENSNRCTLAMATKCRNDIRMQVANQTQGCSFSELSTVIQRTDAPTSVELPRNFVYVYLSSLVT
ncbi:hypothetical protein PR048_008788 [Dryococelus australis]|uniref:Uncharacterized protein n=1 Tax=Dryococelus australis TaxID=614101 RepID=A0ABQ9HY32_9NEOP|nr:hypothetical protein PR048_008788 [Dryococelus australis]